MSSIAETQTRREQEISTKHESAQPGNPTDRAFRAAQVLQRTYRGRRERRQLAGLSLDPSTRWTEAIKEAQYRELTRPRPRATNELEARQRAGGDEKDDENSTFSDEGQTQEQKEARQRKRPQQGGEGTQMIDLSYFLEMVDEQHRYGSNLRKYDAEWKDRSTQENFFYWLDCGEGKDVSLENCPRERLASMRVRYLSREERLNYLTTVGEQGRLCWKKNGIRIDTNVKWKDSIAGIVPADDPTPAFTSSGEVAQAPPANPSSGSDDEADSDASADAREKETTEVPPEQILNRLVRKTSTKSKWIFVADTSYNLYVGIKQSGAFQHSSFLHGSRISSAGLIKIRDGKIKLLQPRSGHYRPPASNFLAFLHALRARGVDVSATSVSKSYAALVGVEGYMKGKSALKEAKTGLGRVLVPEKGEGCDGGDGKAGAMEKSGFGAKMMEKLKIGEART